MHPKEITLRSQQLSLLRQIEHKMSTGPEIGRVLENIMRHPEYDGFDELQKRNVDLIKNSRSPHLLGPASEKG